MSYSIQRIAALMGAVPELPMPGATVDHLLTDSRRLSVPATTLFFALPGLHRSGAGFTKSLYNAGVRNFVVSEGDSTEDLAGANILRVPDPLKALQALAAQHRAQFSMPVIGITGSNGKTIVKEWLYQMLQEDHSVLRSPRSYNSQVGVPLSVWPLQNTHTLAIFEAGISQPGEMERLARIIRPTIGVLTNIGTAHSEGFRSDEEKLHEKMRLFERAEIVIGPERFLNKIAGQKHFTWGEAGADLQVVRIEKGPVTRLHARYRDQALVFSIPFSDEASIENALTCCSVMIYLGYAPERINERLSRLHAVDMRLQLKSGIHDCTIINDSYSADLTSLQLALDFMTQQPGSQRHTVILSDFDETGQLPEKLYPQIAEALLQHGAQRVIAIGQEISRYLPAALTGIALSVYPDTDSFLGSFQSAAFNNENILIKGARRFRFERIVTLLETRIHQTVLEINLNALSHNLKQYKNLLQPGTRTMAMVKAFSYGSGSAEIAGALQFEGIDWLGVAYADEGVALRKAGINLPVMVMNAEGSTFGAITEYQLQPVIYSASMLQAFEDFIRSEGLEQFPVHIEIETGMNRLGFELSELPAIAARLGSSKQLQVQSVFSHLAASEDAAQDDFTREQARLFLEAAAIFQKTLPYPFLRHLANSAAILRHPQMQLDMVRLGIGLYGVEIATDRLHLLPVATLKTTIAQLKHLEAGDTVSYNRRGVVREDTMVATVRIGYADGYSRRLGNGVGHMLVGGILAPVIGTVCMDMTMIDVTHVPNVKEGDPVVVFGAGLPVQQLAQWSDTIPYEIMTSVSQRVPRVYFQE